MEQAYSPSAQDGRGLFITFEGGDGAGKSTHIRFLASVLRKRSYEVLSLREPGGTRIGEKLRRVVLDPGNEELSAESELLVFEAARAQLVSEVVKPALARGAVVLCDRFTDSTVAYQAYGRGLSLDFVQSANAFACQGLSPDRTVLLTAGGSSTSIKRATRRGADRMERSGQEFYERVACGFKEAAQRDPARIRVVESAGKRSATARAVFEQLCDLFPWMSDDLKSNPALFARLDRPPKRGHRGKRQNGANRG
ncbi:MAG TPA: dTMP kinase [Candidatus Aphodovivens excrementavium]|nr:dTMP kinase [Candidatus Aphodovivens excrementavium]